MNHRYLDESHTMVREAARRLREREIEPHIAEWEEAEEFPRALYKTAADAGLLGLGYAEALGGTGGDIFHGIVMTEELTRCGSVGLLAGLFSHNIALPPIVALGTPEQKARFVTPVLAGERIAALAVTEPDAGSDVARIRTHARRDGDHYVVNGAKTFITSGCRADQVTLAVRTGGEGFEGISLLVAEAGTPGFTVSKKLRKMGWCVSDTAELVFEDCRVPAANRIGAEGRGFEALMQNFQRERLALAVMAHAAAAVAYEEAREYARARHAFGRPLTGFQVTRHKLADMATRVEAARAFVYAVAARIEEGDYPVAEVAMAKNFACEQCDRVVYDAVQLHGGYGYAREFKAERLYRDTRILSIGGGTTEIMREIIAKYLQF
jgi:acyl-CoA dehydrogenase